MTALCFALDVDTSDKAIALVDELHDIVDVFKVGLELFIAAGPALVRTLRAKNVDVFLDLKLHDIPHTVAQATSRARDLDVRYLTVHGSGGPRMLDAAVTAAGNDLHILAVTALTSLSDDDLAAVGFAEGANTLVPRLAKLADTAGCYGVVCSPREIALVKQSAPSLACVTPGIRGEGDVAADQQRTMSARQARDAGANMIVVGRPIKDAVDRRAAAIAIKAHLS